MKISPARALAEILGRQHETAQGAELAALAARVGDYARGKPWRDEDVALVWTSPEARSTYLAARRAVLAEAETRWLDHGLPRQFMLRAADDGSPSELVLGDAGVTIRIVRAPASGDWLINVSLSSDAQSLLPVGTRIRLSDSSGATWLTGEPDEDGGIDAFWEEGGSPIARLRECSLTLRFV